MSKILQFSAFSLSEAEKFYGCKDSKKEKQLLASFMAVAEELDLTDKQADAGVEVIQALVNDGLQKDAKKEGEVQIALVTALTNCTSKPLTSDAEMEWPWREIDELERQFAKRYDTKTRKAMELFTVGRNLFGKGFTDFGCYSYLKNAELVELIAGLEKVHGVASDIIESGAMNEQDFESGYVDTLEAFLETLNAVQESGGDLFVLSC